MAVYTDDFTRSSSETPIASPWVTVPSESGTIDLDGTADVAVPHDGAVDAAVYYNNTFANDQYSQAKVTVTGTGGSGTGLGLIVRASTSQQTYYCLIADHASSNNMRVEKVVNGTFTPLGSDFTQAWTDGDTIRLEVSGTTLTIKVNGSTVTTRTDSAITSGKAGLRVSSFTPAPYSWDDWEGGDLTVPPGLARFPNQNTLRPAPFKPGIAR